MDLSTDALSCTPKSASYALNLLNDGSTDKFIDVYMHLLYNDDTVDYTMVSCVIAS